MTDLRELRRLEPRFYRAPSAHNTQPWLLEYAPEHVTLRFDPDRHLAVGDPTRRDLFLSLGALVEAVLIAAADAGIQLRFEAGVDLASAAVGSFVGDGRYATRFRVDDLERRRTSRLAYAPARLAADALEAARGELSGGARLHELDARDVAGVYLAADRHLYDSPAVVEELRRWLRLSPRHPDYRRDGLSYDCLALNRVEAAALALLLRPGAYRAARALRLHRTLTAATRSLVAREGSVLVLEAPAATPEALVEHGRTLLRVWLALARHAASVHPLSQILDCAATEAELHARLRVPPDRRLLSVFRAGVSASPARSHRLR